MSELNDDIMAFLAYSNIITVLNATNTLATVYCGIKRFFQRFGAIQAIYLLTRFWRSW